MASLDDLNSTQKGGVQNLSLIYQALINAFPRITGTFTLANATATVVTQPNVKANSVIVPLATNTAAVALGAVGVVSIAPGVSFTVIANTAATGTETFAYYIVTPA